jgi:opacity protein-like surface antigen
MDGPVKAVRRMENEPLAFERGLRQLRKTPSARPRTKRLNSDRRRRRVRWRSTAGASSAFAPQYRIIDVDEQILGVTRGDWDAAYQLRGGVALGFTQKLVGSLEYRWTDGSKPSFSLAGIPTKLEVDRHSFVVGVNYKY